MAFSRGTCSRAPLAARLSSLVATVPRPTLRATCAARHLGYAGVVAGEHLPCLCGCHPVLDRLGSAEAVQLGSQAGLEGLTVCGGQALGVVGLRGIVHGQPVAKSHQGGEMALRRFSIGRGCGHLRAGSCGLQ